MSNDVKRYDPINSDGTCGMCVEDADYGAYVEYADYAALEAECDELRRRLDAADEWATLASEQLKERDALAAELRALKAQEPIGWISRAWLKPLSGSNIWSPTLTRTRDDEHDTQRYAAPPAAQDVSALPPLRREGAGEAPPLRGMRGGFRLWRRGHRQALARSSDPARAAEPRAAQPRPVGNQPAGRGLPRRPPPGSTAGAPAMTEREMLELAAKACGYEHFRYCEVHMALVPEAEGEDALPFSVWNPLTDDGDALRLAVKLNLTVRITDSAAIVFELCGKHDAVELLSRHGDLCSAARRAIVRAGAEIGRAMP